MSLLFQVSNFCSIPKYRYSALCTIGADKYVFIWWELFPQNDAYFGMSVDFTVQFS